MSTPCKSILFYPRKPLIPPLNQEHIDCIFANHLQSTMSLPLCICTYLKELACCHYHSLRVSNADLIHELSPKDLTMYYLGEDAPFSLIIASFYAADSRFHKMLEHVCLPPDCDDFLRYNAILQNRIGDCTHLIDPKHENTVLNFFDFLLENPFFPGENYFSAGCETSKLLFRRTTTEIDKLLEFDTGKK